MLLTDGWATKNCSAEFSRCLADSGGHAKVNLRDDDFGVDAACGAPTCRIDIPATSVVPPEYQTIDIMGHVPGMSIDEGRDIYLCQHGQKDYCSKIPKSAW
jgi:hypothetical protein